MIQSFETHNNMKRTPAKSIRNFRPQKQQKVSNDKYFTFSFSVKMNNTEPPRYYEWVVPVLKPSLYIYSTLRTPLQPTVSDPQSVTVIALLSLRRDTENPLTRKEAIKVLRDRLHFGIGAFYADSHMDGVAGVRSRYSNMPDDEFDSLMGSVTQVPKPARLDMVRPCVTFLQTPAFIREYYREEPVTDNDDESDSSFYEDATTTYSSESDSSDSESEESDSSIYCSDECFDNTLKMEMALDTLDLVSNTLDQLSAILKTRTGQLRG